MDTRSGEGSTIFHIRPCGNLANQMIQYMVAMKFASMIEGCRISNVNLPEWNIVIPELPPKASLELVRWIESPHHVDFEQLVKEADAGHAQRIVLSGPGQRMENFLPVETYRRIFSSSDSNVTGFGDEYLVFNVRTGDIVSGIHPHYTLLPIDFYSELIESTNLAPVFMGQIEDNSYCRELRRRFPSAVFQASRGALQDFMVIRNSMNLVLSVSTFSWLAGWLSHGKRIYLPVCGLFNPMQYQPVNLLPLNDERYVFFLFPVNYSTIPEKLDSLHDRMKGMWRQVTPEMLMRMAKEQPRYVRTLASYEAHFDESVYSWHFRGLAAALSRGEFENALDHYRRVGFERNIPCFKLDDSWYSASYPLAAFEVAQGDFVDFRHHYAAVGRARGHRATPEII